MPKPTALTELMAENRDLRRRLATAEQTLAASRRAETDDAGIAAVAGEPIARCRDADKRCRALIECMGDGALILTAEGVVTFANRPLADMLGTPLETVIGAALEPWIDPSDRPALQRLLQLDQAIEQGAIEVALVAADGRLVPCRLSCNMLQIDAQTQCVGLIATDLTEQREGRLRIAAAERLADSILEQTAEAVVICDLAATIIRASRSATSLSSQDPIGRPFDRVFHLQQADGSVWSLAEFAGDGDGRTVPLALVDGRMPLSLLVRTGPWLGAQGETLGTVVTLTDITERKAAEDEIKQLAFFDPLTGLPNRRLLQDRLRQTLTDCSRNHAHGALVFIDLDHFKDLNDTLGHDIGDLLLQQVGQRLSECVRKGDTVARLGGDEFVLILKDLSDDTRRAVAQTQTVCEKIQVALNQPYQLAGHDHHSTPSLGVTLIQDFGSSLDELLKQADLAMYQAKAAGRNSLSFFDPAMQAELEGRAVLLAQLREALREEQFQLYYQPQVDGEDRLIGAEALLRWRHPSRGLLDPDAFIPIAEETGLILPLGQWVLETACAQLAAWSRHAETAGLSLAVNVSARQFRQASFVDQVRTTLEHFGLDPCRLDLELTESLLLDDIDDTVAKMTSLKALGVGFALDDFGTGYSSLDYLKRLPLSQLKIDRSFVKDLLTDPCDAAIVSAILALARSFGLKVIAEGVETEAQREFLNRIGCGAFQGFLFGRPRPIEALHIAPRCISTTEPNA